MQITIHHFAAAADASGCQDEIIEIGDGGTIGDLVVALTDRHGPRMGDILRVATFLQFGGVTRDLTVAAAPQVDILPPFAGG